MQDKSSRRRDQNRCNQMPVCQKRVRFLHGTELKVLHDVTSSLGLQACDGQSRWKNWQGLKRIHAHQRNRKPGLNFTLTMASEQIYNLVSLWAVYQSTSY